MRVFVYFNLHKKVWSVKALEGENKGRVIAHASLVLLENCIFKVSQKGRERVLTEKRKNVHAGVVGQLIYSTPEKIDQTLVGKLATYNPYKYETFVDAETKAPVLEAGRVLMSAHSKPQVAIVG